MRIRFVGIVALFSLIVITLGQEYIRMPLIKRYFYDLELGIGTPEQKINLGVTMISNQMVVDCSGEDGAFKSSKSNSLKKIYCVYFELFRIHKILNVPMPVLVKRTNSSALSKLNNLKIKHIL